MVTLFQSLRRTVERRPLARNLLLGCRSVVSAATGGSMRGFIKRHPALTFYVVSFVISQGGVLLVSAPGGIPGSPEDAAAGTGRLFPLALSAWLIGISGTGLVLTCLVHGRTGLRALLTRLLRWRVGARWYAAALLAAPLAYLTAAVVLTRFSAKFDPRILTEGAKASLLLSAVAMGLAGGFLEELGWTGFVIPELLRRHKALTTGLIAGVLWGAWHILLTYWTTGDPAAFWPSSLARFLPVYLVGGVGGLTAYRVLMVWVYDHTQSLLVAGLMHASLIVWNIYLLVPEVTGSAGVIWSFATTAALWLLVAALVVANRRQVARGERPTVTSQTMQRVPQ
jgi:membrane protease YdiL (CAAX protease family)